MKNFVIEELMKGVKSRHVGQENNKLIENWTKTGLLRGLDGHKRETMARLLQNQLSELIRESNQVSLGAGGLTNSGQLQGVTTVTFPLVRRIFGGLVSSEIVSMQAMALPSGLIFFLDFTYGSNVGGDAGVDLSSSSANETYTRGQSIYGNPVGKGIQSGSLTAGGAYDLVGTGFSLLHSGSAAVSGTTSLVGSYAGAAGVWSAGTTVSTQGDFSGSNARWTNFDPQLETGVSEGTFDFAFVYLTVAELTSKIANLDVNYVDQLAITAFATTNGAVQWGEAFQAGTGVLNLRRLNRRGDFDGSTFTPNPMNGTHIQFVIRLSNGGSVPVIGATTKISGILSGLLTVDSGTGSTLTIPSFESNFGTPASPVIPEVDIKIESIAITTTTRKLRARWTPELSQDMNAYHSLDAEVELTQVLSQQIALEIDREILQDLLQGANGANFYWSRAPGRFVNKKNGQPVSLASSLSIGPQFTGNVREWYETLVETVIDVGNTIHRKTLRGSANFLVTSSDVCTIFEASVMYKPKLSIDGDGQVAAPFQIGAEAVGTLSNRFTVYKDPMFPVNRILVGYKGGTALETGYVYAPYVPLIMTPTLYGQEDFTPRRGVMTRYGKKMIRSDFYGTVTVLDMNIILSGLQSVTTEPLSKPGVDRLQACLYLSTTRYTVSV